MGRSGPAPRGPLGWLAVGVVATLVASACCVLPLVLVLAGLAGAWLSQLAVLKPLAPACTVLAIGAFAWSGYRLFLRPAPCGPDGVCPVVPATMRRLYLGSALVAALLLGFPLIAPYFY